MGLIADIPDDYTKEQMIGLGIAFLVIPIVAVVLRLWAKILAYGKLALDDYLLFGGLACAIACCCVQLVAAIDGQLGQHQTDAPDGQPLLRDPRFVTYEKCKFAVNIVSTVGLGFVKSSLLIFYKNIFFSRRFHIVANLVLALVISWTIAFFFANLFTCYPVSPFIEAFYHKNCVDGLSLWYSMAISDIVCDFIILSLPVLPVVKLMLPLKQKLGVLTMFLLGAVVCGCSLMRCFAYVHVGGTLEEHYNDETYYTSPVFFWATIELSTAVMSACLPTYRAIWLALTRPNQSSSSYNGPSAVTPRAGTPIEKNPIGMARVSASIPSSISSPESFPSYAHGIDESYTPLPIDMVDLQSSYYHLDDNLTVDQMLQGRRTSRMGV